MTEPEQWAVELWHTASSAFDAWPDDKVHRASHAAALTIQRAFEERERKLREAATTFAQMMEGWGPEYFPARIVTDYESTASAFDIRWEDVQALRQALEADHGA